MAERTTLPPEIELGIRGLAGLDGFDWRGDLEWFGSELVWAFPFRLSIEVPVGSPIPAVTPWWMTLASTYPAGPVECWPAKDGGIEETYPHQSFNAKPDGKLPWRSGNLCLHPGVAPLRSYGSGTEPKVASQRLLWRVQRALFWLRSASTDQLFLPGDPFELPDFRFGGGERLAFAETAGTLKLWEESEERNGYVVFRRLGRARVALRFENRRGERLVEPQWGRSVNEAPELPFGVWIRLDQLPVLPPWRAPATWQELCALAQDQGVPLADLLLEMTNLKLRDSGKKRAKRPRHSLLVGFPIPERIGDSPLRMHWIGFELPVLAERGDAITGFRSNATGIHHHDCQALVAAKKLPWFATQSWSDDELTGRGKLPESVKESEILLVGAGSLGSALAELLVRGGARSLVVVDPEEVEAGNLVRHTATLADVGHGKAEALVRRLGQLSLYADVVGDGSRFPEFSAQLAARIRRANVVIDTTGNDDLLFQLERFNWGREVRFFLLCLGLGCKRLYFFTVRADSFPWQAYTDVITPWVEEDWDGVDESDLPWEGVGCWEPLMPGAGHDVMLLAASATEVLGEVMAEGGAPSQLRFLVLEQQRRGEQFVGVQRRPGTLEEVIAS